MYDSRKPLRVVGIVFSAVGLFFIAIGALIWVVLKQKSADAIAGVMVMGILGAVFLLIGIAFIVAVSKPSMLEKLKLCGVAYPAKVLRAKADPYRGSGYSYVGMVTLECAFEDNYGKSYVVSQRNYFPNLVDADLKNLEVVVWMDPKNPKKYAIETIEVIDRIDFDYDLRKNRWY